MQDKNYFLGPDQGNSYTDVYSPEGKIYSFPSFIAPGRVEKYSFKFGLGKHETASQKELIGFGGAASELIPPLYLETGGTSYFVGQ